MKITLVCPTNYTGASATRGIYYPLGILLVGSLVKDTHPSWDVAVIDGETASPEALEARFGETDILGLSANTNNYQHCIRLAESAKAKGVRSVVVGGPHASSVLRSRDEAMPLAGLILNNQQSIDAVIVNDGEKAFLRYVEEVGKKRPAFAGIENLFWKDGEGHIHAGQAITPSQPPRCIDMNYSLMDLGPYWAAHKEEFPAMQERYVEGFTHVGCAWREKAGCSFCDIPYPVNAYQAPGRFWRDLKEARHELGISSFKDFGDCLTGNPERVRALLEARLPELADMEFSCYGRSSEITEEMADLLKWLNVRYIYIGFDSGDTRMLRSMREGYRAEANLHAIERLSMRGINITGSLILGAAGESAETIANTEHFAREAIKNPHVTQLHCAILTPFPGALLNRRFLEAHPEYIKQDVWDTEITTQFWIESNCRASYDCIAEKAREINALNPSTRKRYFGMMREEEEKHA